MKMKIVWLLLQISINKIQFKKPTIITVKVSIFM